MTMSGETSFTDPPLTGVETWFVRGGCAVAAMYTFEQPGVYAYVNHNLNHRGPEGRRPRTSSSRASGTTT